MTNPTTRNRTLARIHAAAKADGMTDDDYQANLKKRTGKASCANMTDDELVNVVSATRPTARQRGQIWHLCREIGLEGETDGEAFMTLMRRVLKTQDPEGAWQYLTRTQARRLIAALVGWKRSLIKRGIMPPTEGTSWESGHEKALADAPCQGSTSLPSQSILEPSPVTLETPPR